MKKHVKPYHDATAPELEQQLRDAEAEFVNLKIQQSTGRLEKPSRIRELRRNIARIKTVARIKELAKR